MGSPAETAPSGLTDEEARRRLERQGPNRLVAEPRGARWKELLGTLSDPMALMLGAAAAVYALMGETRDAVILLIALFPVLAIDVILEARSRDALKKLASAVSARVLVVRGGRTFEVPTEDLVEGDVVHLKEGDVAPADGEIQQGSHLSFDESVLTGESQPADKAPGDRFFAGTAVLSGKAVGVITRTGPRTEYGKIARLVAESSGESTPFQRKLHALVIRLGIVAAVAAGILLVLGLLRGLPFGRALLPAISLGMSAAPEEFLLVYTVFLSLGAFRLTASNVLVRRLAAVETLGSTTVICTDKTGTLTSGRFQLERHEPLAPDVTEDELLVAAVLACEPEPADALEKDIVAHSQEHGIDVGRLHSEWRLVHDYPFDPVGKHMSHVWESTGGAAARLVAKGAFEGVLEHCDLTPGGVAEAEKVHTALADAGLRVLAVAGRDGPMTGERESDESGLRLFGFVGFLDALRPEVPGAIAACQRAGIQVKLITGDHALTAHAIATVAGITHDDAEILTGDLLDGIPAADLPARAARSSIFARIRPEQKWAIVDALARSGETVAMTGDGINDAPALKRASIGIAMGRRGTEVARASAGLVLLNDDFTSIAATVLSGRHIFENIQRAFVFLLPMKVTILGLAFVAPVLGFPALLLPVHLVWLELIIHPVAAFLFEAEPAAPDLMERPPRPPDDPLVPKGLAIASVVSGLLVTIAVLGAYLKGLDSSETYARSHALAVLSLASLLTVFAARAGDHAWWKLPMPRGARFWGIWAGAGLSLPLFMAWPAAAHVLRITPISGRDWLLSAGLAVGAVAWRAFGIPKPPGAVAS